MREMPQDLLPLLKSMRATRRRVPYVQSLVLDGQRVIAVTDDGEKVTPIEATPGTEEFSYQVALAVRRT